MIAAIALALAVQAAPPPPSSVVAQMAALYGEACLRTFPDDAALDALMAEKGATPLGRADIAVMLRDDPGRGWTLGSGPTSILIVLELPPYHACSVRARSAEAVGTTVDLTDYRSTIAAFKAVNPGFMSQPAIDMERGGVRAHAEQEARLRSDGRAENLMVIDQQVVDRSQVAPGQTAAPLRFVHQIVDRGAN